MSERSSTSHSTLNSTRRATLAAHVAFLPCGLVTVLLGPLLPILAVRWKLSDTQSGDLFFAQFLASSLGVLISGALVPRRGYRFAILLGLAFMAAGFGLLPLLRWPTGLIAVSSWGIGFGTTIPACNLLVAALHPERKAAALNLLNFFWSLGAVACPFLLAPFANVDRVNRFALVMGAAIVLLILIVSTVVFPDPAISVRRYLPPGILRQMFLTPATLGLAVLFFLYTGVENATGGWLASYAQRSGHATSTLWVTTPSYFYLTLMVGRAVAPFILHKVRDSTLARAGLALSSFGILALLFSASMTGILASACAIGFGLAAIYPISIARMSQMAGALAPQVGSVMFALAGVGASIGPWLVGFTSNQLSSLRLGLVVPLIGSATMLGVYLASREQSAVAPVVPRELIH
jgi:fucose permease